MQKLFFFYKRKSASGSQSLDSTAYSCSILQAMTGPSTTNDTKDMTELNCVVTSISQFTKSIALALNSLLERTGHAGWKALCFYSHHGKLTAAFSDVVVITDNLSPGNSKTIVIDSQSLK